MLAFLNFEKGKLLKNRSIFDTWKKVCKESGCVEYGASPLEPLELYKAKSGSEIVDEPTSNGPLSITYLS